MSLATRLDRLTPGLTGRQRAVLVLQALAAGEEPAPGLRSIDDERERQAFNRYMAWSYVANSELNAVLQMVAYHIQRLEQHTTLELLHEAAAIAERDTGEKADAAVVKRWRKSKSVNITELLLGVAAEVRELLLADVLARWQELRALETLWDELATELGVESILTAEMRQLADATRASLQKQVQRLNGPKHPPEPDEVFMEAVRSQVERAFGYLGLVEPGGRQQAMP